VVLLTASIVSTKLAFQYWQTLGELQKTRNDEKRTLTALQKTAINRAVISAAIGNISQAEEEIKTAMLDNPRDYLEMIEGQKARFEGRTIDGIKHLKEANRLAPNDVIIQAMLADAYLESGDWESYAHTAVAQDRVEAESDYERIFVGHALCWTDTEKSLNLLNEAVENLRHPLAYVYRARTISSIANPNENVSQMESALRDANLGAAFLPESALARSIRLHVHIFAYDLFMKKKLETRAEDVLQEAGEIVAKSEEYRDSYESGLGMGLYYQACGQTEKAQNKFEKTALGKIQVFAHALHPDRTPEEVEQAIDMLDLPPFGTERSIVCRCVLLLDQGRVEEADRIIDDVLSKAAKANWGWAIDLALLRGHVNEGKELAAKLLEQFPKDARGIRVAFLQFNAGRISEKEYIDSVPDIGKGGAYLNIGEYWLARGNRQRAKECFTDALRHSVPPEDARPFSQAFLTKMKKAEEDGRMWPSWIPPSK
jgi:tetratricopeptide (TPR) repeat protein